MISKHLISNLILSFLVSMFH
ncbi:MAG: hypothetical protein E7479_04505 [Ruminococcaceae bacterium]|nr:hypothetical protein [Oscillospiraceae bacterium]